MRSYRKKVYSNNLRSLKVLKHSTKKNNSNTDEKHFAKSHETNQKGGCSSLRRWWKFPASALKLLREFLLINNKITNVYLEYNDIPKVFFTTHLVGRLNTVAFFESFLH